MNKKQFIFIVAKIAFALLVLAWLFHKVNAGRVWAAMRGAERAPVIAGLLLCWLILLMAGLRWRRLLTLFNIETPLWTLVCIAQIGGFFQMFLPGPLGDDLTRMLYISRIARGRVGEACTTVLLDRCIGLAGILLLAVLCIPWQWHLLAASSKTYWLAVGISSAGAVVFVAGALFFLVDGPFMQRLVGKILGRLPASNIKEEFSRISTRIFDGKKIIAEVTGIAIVTQLLLCTVFYLAGRSVGIHSSFAIWLCFVPIVLAANAMPITVAGIGVREYLLVLFLGVLAQVKDEQALAASIMAFAMIFAISLLGGVIYIFYKPRNKTQDAP